MPRRVMMIDPPSGWKYGFPLPFEPEKGESVNEFLMRKGYPIWEVMSWRAYGMVVPCSWWETEEEEEE